MTTPDLLQRLPRMREMFPQPIVQEWSLAEYLVGMKKQEEAMLAGLDKWKAEGSLEIGNRFQNRSISFYEKPHRQRERRVPLGQFHLRLRRLLRLTVAG
jgi:hypothetical protein